MSEESLLYCSQCQSINADVPDNNIERSFGIGQKLRYYDLQSPLITSVVTYDLQYTTYSCLNISCDLLCPLNMSTDQHSGDPHNSHTP